jgi:hypothetical protein
MKSFTFECLRKDQDITTGDTTIWTVNHVAAAAAVVNTDRSGSDPATLCVINKHENIGLMKSAKY